MATVVSFHAHPDDESLVAGGALAKAAAAGHRTVLVFATRGEHGEVVDGFLDPGEALGSRREQECHRSAEILGVQRVVFLDFVDSGMMGTPENDAEGSFWSASVDEVAEQLAALLREEDAEVLTVYDDHGNYGHPDHIQVHRVGVRAAELAGTPIVLEATMNRDDLRRLFEAARATGALSQEEDLPDVGDGSTFGQPEALLTHCIDVRAHLTQKRASMAAHASQIPADSLFLQMPDEPFEASFGFEWYTRRGLEPTGVMLDDIFA
jgi:LmbE family N-acetylglucosaminyl deacetylase